MEDKKMKTIIFTLFFFSFSCNACSGRETTMAGPMLNKQQAYELQRMRQFLKGYSCGHFPNADQKIMHSVIMASESQFYAALAQGGCVNFKDRVTGDTPLICAARLGYIDIVRLLLGTGKIEDINYKNKWNVTALGAATKCVFNEYMVRLLLSHGADPQTAENHKEEVENVAASIKAFKKSLTDIDKG
jgi:hypothetical protein